MLRIEPLARATLEEIIALALPAIEQYLRQGPSSRVPVTKVLVPRATRPWDLSTAC